MITDLPRFDMPVVAVTHGLGGLQTHVERYDVDGEPPFRVCLTLEGESSTFDLYEDELQSLIQTLLSVLDEED